MAIRSKLEDDQMANVSGGISIDNDWGDKTVYKVGKNGEAFTHTFNASDKGEVQAIIAATYDPSLSPEDNEEVIMQALIDSPYLSPL